MKGPSDAHFTTLMSLYVVPSSGGRSDSRQHIGDRGTEGLSNELPIQLRDLGGCDHVD